MKNITKFDSKILSSCHINFLFGAGVNGLAFPQLDSFVKTVSLLRQFSQNYEGFENTINKLNDKQRKKVWSSFKKEYEEFDERVDENNASIKNIKELFASINKLIDLSENRTKTTKQVCIYTINYDEIVEKSINNLGYLINTVSYSNYINHDRFFNLVGYNYRYQKFIPTYLVLKLHGDISNPILPGQAKYDEAMASKRFELFFTMKEKLTRFNSALFVIGYSGRDEHINEILQDCVASGLTVYWFKFKNDDIVPSNLAELVYIIDNPNIGQDTTKTCADMINELWKKQSEE